MPTIDTKFFTVTGLDSLADSVKRVEEALIAAAPKAIEDGAQPVLDMMVRLVPKDTGTLARTIRFSLGAAGGEPRTFKQNPRSSRRGRLYVSGFIVAGDRTTFKRPKGGKKVPGRKLKSGKRGKPGEGYQVARLIEFGTVKMKAQPYFLPSWRVNRTKVRTIIALAMNRAFKASGGKAMVKGQQAAV